MYIHIFYFQKLINGFLFYHVSNLITIVKTEILEDIFSVIDKMIISQSNWSSWDLLVV